MRHKNKKAHKNHKNHKKVKAAVHPCPCSMKKFEVICTHGHSIHGPKIRTSGKAGILQVVAATRLSETKEKKYGRDGIAIFVTEKLEFDGEETVTATITCDAGCQEQIKFEGYRSPVPAWKAGSTCETELKAYSIIAESNELSKAAPQSFTVRGKSVKEEKVVIVEQYPSDQRSYTVKIDGFGYLVKELNESWEKWGKHALGFTPAEVEPKLIPPAGFLTASCGWKEDSENWKVFFETACEAGLDPIFGISINIKVSFLKCAVASAGIPPSVVDFGSKHLADIFLEVGGDIGGKIKGKFAERAYPYGGKKAIGKGVLAIEGSIHLGLSLKLGSEYVYSWTMAGEAKIVLAEENELTVSSESIKFQASVKLKPAEFEVSFTTKAFYVYSKKESNTWKLWGDDVDIWEGDEKTLIDFGSLSEAQG